MGGVLPGQRDGTGHCCRASVDSLTRRCDYATRMVIWLHEGITPLPRKSDWVPRQEMRDLQVCYRLTTFPAKTREPTIHLDASSPLRTVARAECVPVVTAGTQLLARRQPASVPQQVFVHSALSQRLAEQLDCYLLYLIQVRHFHDGHFKLG